VAEVGELAKLVLEPIYGDGVAVRDGLERNSGSPLEVQGLVHDPHTALTELALDHIALGAGQNRSRFWQKHELSQIGSEGRRRAGIFSSGC
jgi:hypothetical protein